MGKNLRPNGSHLKQINGENLFFWKVALIRSLKTTKRWIGTAKITFSKCPNIRWSFLQRWAKKMVFVAVWPSWADYFFQHLAICENRNRPFRANVWSINVCPLFQNKILNNICLYWRIKPETTAWTNSNTLTDSEMLQNISVNAV